jgi:YesN/AraC family two-component response regulator
VLKPDIIFMDISMPFMDGLEASEKIKEYDRNIEIIILTAFDKFEYAKKAIKCGISDYLVKPYSDKEFTSSLNTLIDKIKEKNNYSYQKIYEEDNLDTESLIIEEDDDSNLNIVLDAKKFIEENYMKDIRLDDVAKEVCISSYYFSRIFKKYEGVNYIQYLTKVRMEKAKELILQNKLSIKEIAIEVGYIDQNYFSRAFKKYTKLSPKEYSNKHIKYKKRGI